VSHPPIPPNCEFFVKHTSPKYLGNDVFMLFGYDEVDLSADLPHHDRRMKKIIAAVARCAWLDEAHKHWKAYTVPDGYAQGVTPEDGAAWRMKVKDYRDDCWNNAEAWRVWGEQP